MLRLAMSIAASTAVGLRSAVQTALLVAHAAALNPVSRDCHHLQLEALRGVER
jgi:hypothetical protein